MIDIKRGDMYFADLEPVVGSEQGGKRPVIILQNDIGNKFSPTVVVAAVTSRIQKKTNMPTHIVLHCENLPEESMALLEQIRTIDKVRLSSYIGRVNQEDLKKIEQALLISVGMRGETNEYGKLYEQTHQNCI